MRHRKEADTLWAKRGTAGADTNAVGTYSRDRHRRSPSSRRQRLTAMPGADTLCYYHKTYGDRARKCKSPCEYRVRNDDAADSE